MRVGGAPPRTQRHGRRTHRVHHHRRRHCLLTATLASRTGRQAGQCRRRHGAAIMLARVAPRLLRHPLRRPRRRLQPLCHSTAMQALQTGRRVGRNRRRCGAASMQAKAAHLQRRRLLPMIATPDSRTGRRAGQNPRRCGAAIMEVRAARPHPRHPCPTIATPASRTGRRVGRSQRRRGAANTRARAVQRLHALRPGNRLRFWSWSDECGTDAHTARAIFGCPRLERNAGAHAIFGRAMPLEYSSDRARDCVQDENDL